ncbi:glycoside/pentoside/hexuronide:cation symporter, GPH family [Actinobaculum suis]|uniref:Glycoside/pentoside/hexuronide:cation symporter, GPH family n=1 Tax=Actinobaculum suis TaxID=1657 RepID=A0A1G7DV25_9ACTO|nr:MFS transporter [Actinobaculum suis]MDY5152866.1 MFS transporter [Actinobaculum suis]SDE55016.1 glycoside/pentoside/hexuronide:cation symporter, GPH family [Actinobaculum suis]
MSETKPGPEAKIYGFKGEIKTWNRIAYGAGDMAVNITWAALGMFIVFFYTDVAFIPATAVGTLMLLGRVFDGITDVIVGALVDKTDTRWGKARPWVLFGAIPFAAFSTLLFAVPNTSVSGKLLYAYVTYLLMTLAFTAVCIPYGTINTLMTRDINERAKLNVYRMFMAQIGFLLVTTVTLPLVKRLGNDQRAWVIAFAILTSLSVILFWFTVAGTREIRAARDEGQENLPLKTRLKAMFANKYWILATVFFLVFSVGYALNQSALVYYCKWILGNEQLVSVLTWAFLVPVMVGFLFLPQLIRRYGKTKLMMVGVVISLIGLIVMAVAPASFTVAVTAQILKGLGQVPLLGIVWALFPDTIEYGEWKTGIRSEGLLYSSGSFAQKLGIGIGTALMSWILGMGGYDGAASVQTDGAISAILWSFIYIPMIMFVLQAVILYFYDIDKKLPTIMKELSERQ